MATITGTFETVSGTPTDSTATASGTFETSATAGTTTVTDTGTFTTGTFTSATTTGTFTTATNGGSFRWNGTRWVRQWLYRWAGTKWAPLSYNSDNDIMPPTETVAGFQRIYSEAFNTDVAEGGFTNMTSGSDTGLLNPASPGGAAYATSFKTKTNNQATGEASGCLYSTVKTTSVVGGVFRCRMHYESGVPYSGAIKPLLPGADSARQLYGRYVYRMRLTGNDSNWGSVVDLIEPTTWANGTGEYGHPEVNHVTSPLGSFIRDSDHQTLPNRAGHVIRRNGVDYGSPTGLNLWHIYEMRSQPGRMRLYIDGVVIWDDVINPPSDPLGFLMQCGAPGTPSATSEALVEIDWITISKWVGP